MALGEAVGKMYVGRTNVKGLLDTLTKLAREVGCFKPLMALEDEPTMERAVLMRLSIEKIRDAALDVGGAASNVLGDGDTVVLVRCGRDANGGRPRG